MEIENNTSYGKKVIFSHNFVEMQLNLIHILLKSKFPSLSISFARKVDTMSLQYMYVLAVVYPSTCWFVWICMYQNFYVYAWISNLFGTNVLLNG